MEPERRVGKFDGERSKTRFKDLSLDFPRHRILVVRASQNTNVGEALFYNGSIFII